MMAMKKGMRIGIIGVAVMFLAAGLLYAHDYTDAGALGKPEGRRQPKPIVKALGLTPEQEKSLGENRQAQRQQLVRIVSALKVQKEKLEQAIKEYSVTKADVEPIVRTIKALQARLIDQRINGIFAAKDILTPEQFTKFQKLVAQYKGKGRKMQRPGFGHQQHQMQGPGYQGE
jgi:Spy/CpxP family protein refolding chaperone